MAVPYGVVIIKTKGTNMTDKRWMRMLSGAKLAALVGQSPRGALAEIEIERRKRRRERKASRLAQAA